MKTLLLLAALAGTAALSPRLPASETALAGLLPSPAVPGSQCSNLTAAPDGTLYLTYSASGAAAGERALYLAALAPSAERWTTPRLIVSTPLLLENWADFPSLCVGTDGALTAQWFQKPTADARGYDGWFARSTDRGATWTKPAPLGHEFVALAPLSGGRTLAVWLDSVGTAHNAHNAPSVGAPAMRLLSRLLAPDGSTLGEWTIDPDVCTCCQNTVAVLPGDRVFAAYRGHTADEIRDNKFAVFDLSARQWSAPATLKNDGWKIAACPVNGPAADARGSALAVAWFTAANGTARVQASYSADSARTFGAPVAIDLGRPMGRIETVVLADRSAFILWMEMGTAENAAGVYARRLFADGKLSPARLVANSTQARASGFPRAALRPNGHIVMSWTQTGETSQVLTLEFDPSSLARDTPKLGQATPLVRPGPPVALELCFAPVPGFHPAFTP